MKPGLGSRWWIAPRTTGHGQNMPLSPALSKQCVSGWWGGAEWWHCLLHPILAALRARRRVWRPGQGGLGGGAGGQAGAATGYQCLSVALQPPVQHLFLAKCTALTTTQHAGLRKGLKPQFLIQWTLVTSFHSPSQGRLLWGLQGWWERTVPCAAAMTCASSKRWGLLGPTLHAPGASVRSWPSVSLTKTWISWTTTADLISLHQFCVFPHFLSNPNDNGI